MEKENKTKWELFKEGTTSPRTLSEASIAFLTGMMLGALVAAYKFLETNVGLTIFFGCLGLLQGVSIIREVKQYKGIREMEKELKKEELEQTKLTQDEEEIGGKQNG